MVISFFSWTLNNGFMCFGVRRYRDFWDQIIFPQIEMFWNELEKHRDHIDSLPFFGLMLLNSMKFGKGQRQEMMDKGSKGLFSWNH